jgi:hypothetical protein
MTSDQQTVWIKLVENDLAGLKSYALPLFGLIVLAACGVTFFALRWIKGRGLKSADALSLGRPGSR